MIRVYTELGELMLPQNDELEIAYTNSLLTTDGSQSVVIALPWTQKNLQVLEFPNRLDRAERFKTSRNAWLLLGATIQACTLKIFELSEADGIQATFYFANGDLNTAIGDTILMTDLTWEIRDPFTGTTDQKVAQWVSYLQQVMRHEVNDDYYVFPSVVTADGSSSITGKALTSFRWLNGIHANGAEMELDANYEQVELSTDPGITITTLDSTITVTQSSKNTEDIAITVQWLVGSTNSGSTQHGGRTTITIPAGKTTVSFTVPVAFTENILAATLNYITPVSDPNVVYLPIGYGLTPFLKTSYVLRSLFAYFGYTLQENIFDTDPTLKYRVEMNNTADTILPGTIDFSQLVPDQTVSDYLNSIRNRFNVQFVPDGNKNITVWSWDDMLNTPPDMDLTPYIGGKPLIEYQEPTPLALSEASGGSLSSPPLDTYEKFIKKYISYTTWRNGASPVINTDVLFDPAQNAFFSSGSRIGSSFFNIVPAGDNTESISASDSVVGMVCVNPDGIWYTGIYCPVIGSRRHLNTQVEYLGTLKTEETVDLSIMPAFAVPSIQQSYTDNSGIEFQYRYYMGSTSHYDGSGNIWGTVSQQYWGDYGTYAKCFFNRDMVKRNSFHRMTIDLHLDFVTMMQIATSKHIMKYIHGQPFMIEQFTVSMDSKRITKSEIILRTTRQYINTSEGTVTWYWANFVCETVSAALQSNLISATGSGTLITVSASQAVTSAITVNLNWIADFHGNTDDTDVDTQSTGTETVVIPVGQTSVSLDIDSEVHSNEEISSVNIDSISPVSDNTYMYYAIIGGSSSGNSGYQRTLDIQVAITYDNFYVSYNDYDGKQAFAINGNIYSAITNTELQSLGLIAYEARLNDWIAFFNANYLSRFPTLVISTTGSRIYNTSACPL